MTPYPKPEPRPKKQPTPLKRTQLPQGPSSKQSANLRKYEQGKREKYGTIPHICTGCDCNTGLSCSHLVGRSHSFDMVADKSNHEMQCARCHDATERGQFFELRNGLRLLEKLWGGLGDIGRQRFWHVLYQWPQNRDLWAHSSFYNSEIHDIA